MSARDDGVALDWLMDWALAQDQDAPAHYWHLLDGVAAGCGCRYEGESAAPDATDNDHPTNRSTT